MRFFKTVAASDPQPKWHGLVWYKPDSYARTMCPVPFHIPIRLGLRICRWFMKFGWKPSDRECYLMAEAEVRHLHESLSEEQRLRIDAEKQARRWRDECRKAERHLQVRAGSGKEAWL